MHCHPNAILTPRGRAKVFEAVEAGMTVAAACLGAGISRRCYYRWLPRWQAQGPDGLTDRASRPHHSPRRLSLEEEVRVIAVRLLLGTGPRSHRTPRGPAGLDLPPRAPTRRPRGWQEGA